MPWQEVSTLSLRCEFVSLAMKEGTNITELCSRFAITPKTGYKWIHRFEREGLKGLNDRSRRPHISPNHTPEQVERLVLKVRDAHPCWGARKIYARLSALRHKNIPSPSSITRILRRYNRIDPVESSKHKPWKRFEHEVPNGMWQMDFKGHFALDKGRCHPLTVLDDHSRYAVGLQACPDETRPTVESKLIVIFRRYGLPESILVDNGSSWGRAEEHPHTKLTVWLIRLGITVIHSRAYHPQTLGKDERFHRTLKAEVLQNHAFRDIDHCQEKFDPWRYVYNFQRPHEALGMDVPASRYKPSSRSFPEVLPSLEYAPEDIVRKVQAKGEIFYKNKIYIVSRALHRCHVALRPSSDDGVMDVFLSHQKVAEINLRVENGT